jgi:hypothetical protein
MYYFILFYVTFECICIQTTATGCLPSCSWQIYQYQYYFIHYMRAKQNGSDGPKCMSQLYAIELDEVADGNDECLNIDC